MSQVRETNGTQMQDCDCCGNQAHSDVCGSCEAAFAATATAGSRVLRTREYWSRPAWCMLPFALEPVMGGSSSGGGGGSSRMTQPLTFGRLVWPSLLLPSSDGVVCVARRKMAQFH